MFYDLYCKLCDAKGVSPTRAAIDLGISRSSPTTWKVKGTKPGNETMLKMANYFNVSLDYLFGQEEKTAPTETGESGLEFDFSNLMNADGTPADDEKKQIILRILSMGKDDTSKLMKWIEFMDDLNQIK